MLFSAARLVIDLGREPSSQYEKGTTEIAEMVVTHQVFGGAGHTTKTTWLATARARAAAGAGGGGGSEKSRLSTSSHLPSFSDKYGIELQVQRKFTSARARKICVDLETQDPA